MSITKALDRTLLMLTWCLFVNFEDLVSYNLRGALLVHVDDFLIVHVHFAEVLQSKQWS